MHHRQRGDVKPGALVTDAEANYVPDEVQQKRSNSSLMFFLPTSAILATLLIASMYCLKAEQQKVQVQNGTINELKHHIRLYKDEMAQLRKTSIWSDDEGAQQQVMRQAQKDLETLRAQNDEANKKLQDMISRVSQLQLERGKLARQVQVVLKEKKACLRKLGEDDA